MGAGQSTRTVTVANDDLSFISLSDTLVKRIVGEGSEESSSGSPRSDNPNPPAADAAPADAPAPARRPVEEPKIQIVPGYTAISTMQLQREVEAACSSVEKYWQHRMNVHAINDERARAVEEENYQKGLAEVQRAFKGHNTVRYQNPCTDKSNVLTQCYIDNPKTPLNCHNEVQAFSACVQNKHRNMMQART